MRCFFYLCDGNTACSLPASAIFIAAVLRRAPAGRRFRGGVAAVGAHTAPPLACSRRHSILPLIYHTRSCTHTHPLFDRVTPFLRWPDGEEEGTGDGGRGVVRQDTCVTHTRTTTTTIRRGGGRAEGGGRDQHSADACTHACLLYVRYPYRPASAGICSRKNNLRTRHGVMFESGEGLT